MSTIATRPVTRQTSATTFERGRRPIIITIHPCGDIELRAKGLKTSYRLTLEAMYALAVKKDIEAKTQEKKKNAKKNGSGRKKR